MLMWVVLKFLQNDPPLLVLYSSCVSCMLGSSLQCFRFPKLVIPTSNPPHRDWGTGITQGPRCITRTRTLMLPAGLTRMGCSTRDNLY